MVYRFIEKYKYEFGLRWLLRKFELYPNSYYNYLKNRKKEYLEKQNKIYEEIKTIYYSNNGIIGHRWMVVFLARKNIYISKTTAHKYMNKDLKLHAVTFKKKPKYIRGERNKIFPNMLKQNFNIAEKNKVWCTDFTYIKMKNGAMRYNCTIIDLANREAIATQNSKYITSNLAINTLNKAVNNYVYVWYNHIRPHNYNGNLTPFEARNNY